MTEQTFGNILKKCSPCCGIQSCQSFGFQKIAKTCRFLATQVKVCVRFMLNQLKNKFSKRAKNNDCFTRLDLNYSDST